MRKIIILDNRSKHKFRLAVRSVSVFLLISLVLFTGRFPEFMSRFDIVPQVLLEKLEVSEAKAASNDVILLWNTASGSVPVGWTCISCSSGQEFYGVFPRASSSYATASSSYDNHTHTTSYSSATQGADGTALGNAGSVSAVNTHTHTWSAPTIGSGDIRPPFRNLNLIYANNPSVIPANVIGIFSTSTLPSGWSRYGAMDNNYLRGYSDNATGGTSTHTHTTGAVTSGTSGVTVADSGSGANAANDHTHSISASSFSNSASNSPPYVDVVFAYNSSGSNANIPGGLIAFFNASPPSGWNTISTSSPWSGSFLKGASSYGGTGGTSTHNHGGSQNLTSGAPSSTTGNRGTTGSLTSASTAHTHAVTYTITASSSLPVYRDVILAEYSAPPPNLSSYTSSETALNYANCGTTGCGGRTDQTITLSGTFFGGTVANKDTCTAGSTNGCVRIGNYTVPAASISTWNSTQIIFTVPTAISVFGGTGTSCGSSDSGVCVTQNAATSSAIEFWVFPKITSVSPSGAGEGKEGDAVTLSGTRFDTGSATGTVAFKNCATGDVSASINSWSDTSVSVIVPTGIANDDDSCDILLTRAVGTGSKTATSANFIVLPEIDSIVAIETDRARTYDAGDTDGLIMLIGTHFNSAGSVTVFGSSTTQHATAEGPCSIGGWSATTTCREVPNNPAYTGNIVLTRTSDSKTNTYAGFRILPRLTLITPGAVGAAVTAQGNHLCQNGGSCPSSFNASNAVTFAGGVAATYFGSWTDTAISTQVPEGALNGKATVISNTYLSNEYFFTIAGVPTSYDYQGNFNLQGTIQIQ